MKKVSMSFFVIIILTTTLLSSSSQVNVKADPNIILVPDNYSSIQEAINAASDGDTVFIRNGTYFGAIVVNKTITLVGENQDSTTINGTGSDYIITVTADDVVIKGLTILNSRRGPGLWCGINILSPSDNNIISNNNIIQNQLGIVLWASSNNSILKNIISTNAFNGIHLIQSANNIISGNTISSNNNDGIYFGMGSRNNIVYHNNFINNNNQQVEYDFIANINNTFNNDYPSGGNYWSDYNGTDSFMGSSQNVSGNDGIGDSPYVIHQENQDKYPLMGRFFNFEVNFKDKPYQFNIISNSTISDIEFSIGPETGSRNILFRAVNPENTVGFCRIEIPTGIMKPPYIVLVGNDDIDPINLYALDEKNIVLYFKYTSTNQFVTIISSETLNLLQQLLNGFEEIQTDLSELNETYLNLLGEFDALLENYTKLKKSSEELNMSYQEHLTSFTESIYNLRNLMYMFAASTAIFLLTTIYLSRNSHMDKSKKIPLSKNES